MEELENMPELGSGAAVDAGSDQLIRQAVLKMDKRVGELALRKAFRSNPFVYGTQGKGSSTVRAAKVWAAGKFDREEQLIGRELNLFEPGLRVATYISQDVQMMDMYYGQKDNGLYLKRDPVIAEFVHYAMGYKVPFQGAVSGRDVFLGETGKAHPGFEGWQGARWEGNTKIEGPKYGPAKTTATVEISRIIRWGTQKYGGSLIFEGKEVYYSQVFNLHEKSWKGDTDREAVALFAHFRPGQLEAKFGSGTITFYWNGRETVPTHCHFLSNWGFPADAKVRAAALEQQRATNPQSRLPNYRGKKDEEIGALQHHALNRGNLEEWLKGENVILNKKLWDNFREVPMGLEGVPVQTVLRLFHKGLGLGYI